MALQRLYLQWKMYPLSLPVEIHGGTAKSIKKLTIINNHTKKYFSELSKNQKLQA